MPLIDLAVPRVGYAIALHGSMRRDLDLVAVPWTDRAVSAERLVEAVKRAIGWRLEPGYTCPITGPERKPHGRRAWTIPLGVGAYIDLSVMPRERGE